MAEKMNIVEKANKVLTFRKYIREECRKKGLEYPSDEKIAEYITSGLGMEVEEFMKLYESKQGIFTDPFEDFKKEIMEYAWATAPTDEEMRSYVAANGYNVKGFLRDRTIKSYDPLEKATLLETLKLNDVLLVKLWNKFIEESAMYGEDSYIYDLINKKDVEFLTTHMDKKDKAELTRIIRNEELHGYKVRYIQWFSLNNNEIHVKNDIKGIIIAYWSDIFNRVLKYPYLYADIDGDNDYFFNYFLPCLIEGCGYKFDEHNGEFTYKKD